MDLYIGNDEENDGTFGIKIATNVGMALAVNPTRQSFPNVGTDVGVLISEGRHDPRLDMKVSLLHNSQGGIGSKPITISGTWYYFIVLWPSIRIHAVGGATPALSYTFVRFDQSKLVTSRHYVKYKKEITRAMKGIF